MSRHKRKVAIPFSGKPYTSTGTVDARLYAYRCMPLVVLLLILSIFNYFILIAVAVTVVLMVVNYHLFNKLIDRFPYKYLTRKYFTEAPSTEHSLLRQIEKNPTEENLQAVKKHIESKK